MLWHNDCYLMRCNFHTHTHSTKHTTRSHFFQILNVFDYNDTLPDTYVYVYGCTTKSQTNCCASACHSVADLISLSIRHFTGMWYFYPHRNTYTTISRVDFSTKSHFNWFICSFVRMREFIETLILSLNCFFFGIQF